MVKQIKRLWQIATLNMLWFSVANLHFSKKKVHDVFFSPQLFPHTFHIRLTSGNNNHKNSKKLW